MRAVLIVDLGKKVYDQPQFIAFAVDSDRVTVTPGGFIGAGDLSYYSDVLKGCIDHLTAPVEVPQSTEAQDGQSQSA